MNNEQPSTSHPYAKGFSEGTVHREEVLEVHLCKALVEHQGYRPRRPEDYYRASPSTLMQRAFSIGSARADRVSTGRLNTAV